MNFLFLIYVLLGLIFLNFFSLLKFVNFRKTHSPKLNSTELYVSTVEYLRYIFKLMFLLKILVHKKNYMMRENDGGACPRSLLFLFLFEFEFVVLSTPGL